MTGQSVQSRSAQVTGVCQNRVLRAATERDDQLKDAGKKQKYRRTTVRLNTRTCVCVDR